MTRFCPLITAENISYHQGCFDIITNLSLSVSSGEALVVRGKNGCGKTTLLRLLARILIPTKGQIVYHPQTKVSFLGHKNALHPRLSVKQNLILQMPFFDENFGYSLEAVLDRFGLKPYENDCVKDLSAGYQRRVALAKIMTMRHEKKIWLLDEPFAHLDQDTKDFFCGILKNYVSEDAAVIITSHETLPLSFATEWWLDA